MAISPVPEIAAYRKLWAAWEPLSEDEKERVKGLDLAVALDKLEVKEE